MDLQPPYDRGLWCEIPLRNGLSLRAPSIGFYFSDLLSVYTGCLKSFLVDGGDNWPTNLFRRLGMSDILFWHSKWYKTLLA